MQSCTHAFVCLYNLYILVHVNLHKPILTSKLYILFNVLTPFRWILLKPVEQGSFCQDDWDEGLQPYTNF